MTPDPTDFPGAEPGPPPVGSYVPGPWDGPRQVVRWADQLRDYHELADHVDPDREAYLSLYAYPPADYCRHFVRTGASPRGYTGPAACPALLFDIDRAGDLAAALADTRTLVRFLIARWPKIEDGLGVYFSGAKGFHATAELLPAFTPSPAVPGVCKRLALRIAAAAGVRIDTACFDHQRLVRLPNSRHPGTGLHKRFLSQDELFALDVVRIQEIARHPAGCVVPSCGEHMQELEDDWLAAARESPVRPPAPSPGDHPAVPKFVRDFIGWQDVQDPGRAVTLFRCAATLAEAGTPGPVIVGLLEEPALKSGLEPAEVRRQIATGSEYGRRKGGVRWP
ncbi:MAG: hypothetical protein JWO38_5757 [Gemmataceae bacterium]|nr:hypothetical protein [Gemmataceae bacterium]